ncbi:hypothetical protein TrST_g13979 [Triparma strigata]|uniref:EGF-like domain-containing protein n=1 Tax=Triparma strigata TaxID=1606541 RepID=A0A9W7BH18_9STRA|nr:hypothetical protein TrST_g13979 [Triparma strigata]
MKFHVSSLLLVLAGLTTIHAAPNPSKVFDFRGCTTGSPVTESVHETLLASPINGPTCGADGLRLDGNDDYADIDDFEFGGTTSFEVYVKYDSFNSVSRVFDFSNGEASDNVILYNSGTTSTIGWDVYQGSTPKYFTTSNFDSSTWTHVVVTVSGNTRKVYKNGAPAGTKTDGLEPNVLTRTQHWLGRSAWSHNDYFDGTIAYVKMWHGVELQQSDVTDLYTPHNTAHHFWDFRGCTTGGTVTDSIAGDLVATPMNGPVCGADGLRLDGNNEYADIDDWEWGGTTSIEVYVKYDSFNEYSRVFDFGNGENNDNVVLCNTETTSTIRWAVFQESTNKAIETSNFDSASWTHVVATVSGTTMKVYKNGVLAGTKTDAYEPNVLTRTQHWLGRGAWSNDGYTDGTIAYVKMWHGVELQQSDVTTLYVAREKCVASTSPSDNGSDGNLYCINGGTVSGVSGSCTCTSCNTGFGGSSCQDPLSCVASTSPSDTGSDGNLYCINGGTVSGVSGSCTCTCADGYGGSGCEAPEPDMIDGEGDASTLALSFTSVIVVLAAVIGNLW